MHFVVIAAFAILLSDQLPAPGWNILEIIARSGGWAKPGPMFTLGVVLAQIPILALLARLAARRSLAVRDGTNDGDNDMEDRYAGGGFLLTIALFAMLVTTFLFTDWLPVVRTVWKLERWPLAAELVALAPFFLALVAAWINLYPAEAAVRQVGAQYLGERSGRYPRPWTLGSYLIYKVRHQLLIVAAPMCLVLLAKFGTHAWRGALIRWSPRTPWLPEACVGIAATLVAIFSPVLLRYLWVTKPLPPGPLRAQLEAMCGQVGLRCRDILIWDSGGLMVNAAVMGLLPSVRYVLLSDGLLAAMDDRQIEAVFAHEAGHVRRHHLLFFGVFALLSMLAVGGVLELLIYLARPSDAVMQLAGLALILVFWGLAFGFVSRKFERQADLFGATSVTRPTDPCEPGCRVHDPSTRTAGVALCTGAARLFGRTLLDVARFNCIPPDANSWRHGTIQSRCELLERFALNPALLREFERGVARLKTAMFVMTLIGCGIAAWLYWPTAPGAAVKMSGRHSVGSIVTVSDAD